MSDLPFKFPVLRFSEPGDSDEPGNSLDVHCDDSAFVVGSEEHIDRGFFVGELIFDALGRVWRLNDLADLGYWNRPFWGRVCGVVFRLNDIRYELSEQLEMSFSDVKERVLAIIAADPELYSRGEYAVEVFDASKSNEELLEEFVGQVRNCERPLELIAAIYFHDLT